MFPHPGLLPKGEGAIGSTPPKAQSVAAARISWVGARHAVPLQRQTFKIGLSSKASATQHSFSFVYGSKHLQVSASNRFDEACCETRCSFGCFTEGGQACARIVAKGARGSRPCKHL